MSPPLWDKEEEGDDYLLPESTSVTSPVSSLLAQACLSLNIYNGISFLNEIPFKFSAKLDAHKNKLHYQKEQSLTYLYAEIHQKENKGCLLHFSAFVMSHVTDTALKKMTENLTLCWWRSVLVHQGSVLLRQSVTDILSELWSAGLLSYPSKATVFPSSEIFSVWEIQHFQQ